MSVAHIPHGGGPEFAELRHRLGVSLVLADLTATDMSERIGVHRNTIGHYLRGVSAPTDNRLKLWAWHTAEFGCTYEWLKYGDSTPNGGADPSEQVSKSSPCMTDDAKIYQLPAAA